MQGKSREAVIDALNGEYATVDAAVRRALIALATEQDEHAVRMEQTHKEMLEHVDTGFASMATTISKIQASLIATVLSVVSTIITAIIVNAVI